MLTLISQNDPRWKFLKLPPCQRNMAQIGCTSACLLMVDAWYGGKMTVQEFLAKTRRLADGRILWNSVNFPTWKFAWRGYRDDRDKILKALKGSPKTTVILEVDHSHWLFVIGSVGKSLKVVDPYPYPAKKKWNWRNVTGYATTIAVS